MVSTMTTKTGTESQKAAEWFRKSDLYRDLRAKEAAEIFEKRRAAAQRLKDLAEEEATVIPPLARKSELAERRVEKLENQLQQARLDHNAACEALAHAENQIELQRRRNERFLTTSAPGEIDRFLKKLSEWLHGDADGHHFHRELHQHNYEKDEGRWRVTYSNWAAVRGWSSAVQKAIEEARKLQLEALTTEELAKRLTEIEEKIPNPATVRADFSKV